MKDFMYLKRGRPMAISKGVKAESIWWAIGCYIGCVMVAGMIAVCVGGS